MKGLAYYLCEECRRVESVIERDARKKENSSCRSRLKRLYGVSNPLRCFNC